MKHPNRTPVPPIKTRVPEVTTRDPEPVTRDPVIEVEPPKRQTPCIVRVPTPACPKCGHTVFREGGTSRPNVTTGEMLRYRACGHCGRSFYLASPMTEKQEKLYGVTA